MTREEYAETWRQYIAARAAAYGMTVVDVEFGPVEADSTQEWCEVRERGTGDVVYAWAESPAVLVADLVATKARRGWLFGAEIETELAALLDEHFGPEAH